MSKLTLKAEERELLGKKVKKLRREGFLPLNLYGREFKSKALQSKLKDFQQTFKQSKSTQVVYLQWKKNEASILIQNVQRHPTKDLILHADLRKIDLKKKAEVEVPIKVIGELEVVKSGEADLLILLDQVTVECLPTKIPEEIIIDISKLEGTGAEVRIKDLSKSTDYEYKGANEQLVLQIAEAKKEEVAPPPPAEGEEAPEGEAAEKASKEEEKEGAEESKTDKKTKGKEEKKQDKKEETLDKKEGQKPQEDKNQPKKGKQEKK